MGAAKVFHEEDRLNMTPCMTAFEKWCGEHRDVANAVGVQKAWIIFRQGFWASEDRIRQTIDEKIAAL